MKQGEIAARLVLIEQQVAALAERQIGSSVPADRVAESLSIIADNAARTTELVAAAKEQRGRILEIVTWLNERMTNDELQHQFDDVLFVTKQLISIMQGSRTDLVEMRADLRRLSALLEQTLRARAEDDGDHWNGEERRRTSSADRRRAS